MPTFSAMTLDRFFDPGSRKPPLKPPPPAPARPERASLESKKTMSRLQASPALYAIPEAAPPLPDSPSSFPPSPYVVNHKRRGPQLVRNPSHDDASEEPLLNDSQKVEAAAAPNGPVHNEPEAEAARNGSDTMIHEDASLGDGPAICDETEKHSFADVEKDGDNEDFFDLQNSMSTSSNTELEEGCGIERSFNPNTLFGEYYDAMEEISSEVALSSYRNMEAALHQMRLNLSAEIERRKQAEEAFEKLRSHWQKLSHGLLSNLGMNLPAMVEEQIDGLPVVDPVDEFCQQLIVTRAVTAAVDRGGCCRAEIEQEMEPQVEAKNFEISRLKDRLQYYEAANKEMSQRNQETVEIARQERLKRKRRRKWLWGAAGLVVTLGVASLAWPHLSSSKPASPVETDTSEGASGGHETS